MRDNHYIIIREGVTDDNSHTRGGERHPHSKVGRSKNQGGSKTERRIKKDAELLLVEYFWFSSSSSSRQPYLEGVHFADMRVLLLPVPEEMFYQHVL